MTNQNIRRPRGRDRGACARAQLHVGGDERAVEVARERLHSAREVRRQEVLLAARCGGDVRRDVGDLLLRQHAPERRHDALAVRHAVDDESLVGLRRRRGWARPSRTCLRPTERMAAPAVRREDDLPRYRIPLGRRRGLGGRRLCLLVSVVSSRSSPSWSSRSSSSRSAEGPCPRRSPATPSSLPSYPHPASPIARRRRRLRRSRGRRRIGSESNRSQHPQHAVGDRASGGYVMRRVVHHERHADGDEQRLTCGESRAAGGEN